jgi:hypothetical protein
MRVSSLKDDPKFQKIALDKLTAFPMLSVYKNVIAEFFNLAIQAGSLAYNPHNDNPQATKRKVSLHYGNCSLDRRPVDPNGLDDVGLRGRWVGAAKGKNSGKSG